MKRTKAPFIVPDRRVLSSSSDERWLSFWHLIFLQLLALHNYYGQEFCFDKFDVLLRLDIQLADYYPAQG